MEDFLDKDLSTYLKGIAIILMVLHHAFGNPAYYIEGIQYDELEPYTLWIAKFGGFGVVSLFLFLTGYTYYKHKDKSIRYSLRKIVVFLLDFWIVLFFTTFIATYFCGYKISLWNILGEMFGLKLEIMIFAWYVPLYILVMLILPMVHYFITNNKKIFLFVIFVVVYGIMGCILVFPNLGNQTIVFTIKELFIKHFPIAIIGYLCARYNFINRIWKRVTLKKIELIILLVCITIAHIKFYNLGKYLFTPIYILAIKEINLDYNKNLSKIIFSLAKHSMNIWFLHCLFFSEVTRPIFQEFAFIPYNPLLVVCWILIVCMLFSFVITPIQDYFNKKINRVLS